MNVTVDPGSLFPTHDLPDAKPLVVDLDGTLIKSDLLHESFFDAVSRNPLKAVAGVLAGRTSKQGLKARLAELSRIEYGALPYNPDVLAYVEQAKREGRAVYLATASNRRHAEGVAAHLGIFDGIFCSDEAINLKGANKARALVEAFGENGFDYIGNDASDLDIWRVADQAISVGLPARATAKLNALRPRHLALPHRGFDSLALVKAMRPHQYAKNLLLFVPLLTAHRFDLLSVLQVSLAFIAFSICASSVYLLNDLIDLQSDRSHPTKKNRPFASGRLPIALGIVMVPALIVAAFAIALAVSPLFCAVLAGYFALTTAYSFSLKRKMVIDVVALATLYTVRVVSGAVAIEVTVSEWLLAFSLLIFTALALVKRYTELSTRLHEGLEDPSNRNYKKTDLPVIAALAAAAGMNAVTVIALYVSSPAVQQLYTRPALLWGLFPLFLYWISRVVMLAHRRIMDEDPIAFALKDPRSWVVGAASVGLVLAAI